MSIQGMSIKGMSIRVMIIKGMSIKGMRVRTGHPRSSALVCRSRRDRIGNKGA